MAKYSERQLKAMALKLLESKANNDDRYLEFCFEMMVRTGAPVDAIERKIVELAAL